MFFAIVFGLCMDYEVFLISRIHEEWEKSGDAEAAVATGLQFTGKIITAAAAIMILVFASFGLGDDRIIKMFGLGLASAIFFDAVIIRCLLVPALMEIAGKRAWWLPSWLDRRMPRVAIERERRPRARPSSTRRRPQYPSPGASTPTPLATPRGRGSRRGQARYLKRTRLSPFLQVMSVLSPSGPRRQR